jgi:hypothetical protein
VLPRSLARLCAGITDATYRSLSPRGLSHSVQEPDLLSARQPQDGGTEYIRDPITGLALDLRAERYEFDLRASPIFSGCTESDPDAKHIAADCPADRRRQRGNAMKNGIFDLEKPVGIADLFAQASF